MDIKKTAKAAGLLAPAVTAAAGQAIAKVARKVAYVIAPIKPAPLKKLKKLKKRDPNPLADRKAYQLRQAKKFVEEQ